MTYFCHHSEWIKTIYNDLLVSFRDKSQTIKTISITDGIVLPSTLGRLPYAVMRKYKFKWILLVYYC